jgi:hypothetical protein
MKYFYLHYSSRVTPHSEFKGLVEYSARYRDKYPLLTVVHIDECTDEQLSSIKVGDSFVWLVEEVEGDTATLHEWISGGVSRYFDVCYESRKPNTKLAPIQK